MKIVVLITYILNTHFKISGITQLYRIENCKMEIVKTDQVIFFFSLKGLY